jgi:ribosomal protein S18 acetylase RimI-like enzyme
VTNNIIYQIKTAMEEDICFHLNDCSDSFIPSLNSRVNIEEYSKKIAERAVTFEAWINGKLIGLIATYFNFEAQYGYITSVSVSKQFMGAGIASELLKRCISHANTNMLKEIKLEVYKENIPAINFYKKYNFAQNEIKNDSMFMSHLLDNY